uniref:Transmembrane protein 115-like n=1 Tax=Ciona intestinalis TaxID=7719 RepID=F6QDJ6_CIOIN|nr:transmembrane protein 115-like [Ciona intestinalis]|eukprot:XP_002129987.1 transmembrane protein 115-like [Ciona intestinalis]
MASGLLVNARLASVNFIRETSLTAKLGCVLLSLFYALSYVFDTLKPLAITPGFLIPPNFWIWTIFTYQFIEVKFFVVLTNFLVLIYSSQVLEPAWGMIGFLSFFGIVTVLSGFLSGFFYLSCYMVTRSLGFLFEVSIHGMAGYTAGVLVALKQCRGDQMIVGSVGLFMKHLPIVNILLVVLLRIAGLITGSYVVLVCFGTLVAWVYLRFYQGHSRGRGDAAENFSFKSFFPKPLDAPMGIIAGIVYNILLKVKLCRKTSYRYDVGAPSKITISLSGVDALDAERRRNKAIKALDERLQKAEQQQNDSSEWPEMEDDTTNTEPRSVEDSVSTSSGSSRSDIVRIEVETSSPSDENPSP